MNSDSIPQSSEPIELSAQSNELDRDSLAAASPSATKDGLRVKTLFALVAVFLGGLVGWGVVESMIPVFVVGEEYNIPNLGAPPELFERARLAHAAADQKNATLTLAILGGFLSLGLAMSESATRRSGRLLALAPVIGGLFGGLAGYLGGYLHEIVARDGSLSELVDVIKIHASMLVPLGFGVGLGMGALTSVRKVMVLTSLVGAVAGGIAAVGYTLLVSIAIPTVSTDALLPASPFGRFLWMAVAAAMFGIIIPSSAREQNGIDKPERPQRTR